MPRIRTVKPEFWADEKISLFDPTTRLVFLGLICMADDAGRLVDNVKLLDGQIFPSTDDTCRAALDILASNGRVLRYQSPSGQRLLQITNWGKHQRVDNPSKHNLPAPPTLVPQQPAVPSADANGASSNGGHPSRIPRDTLARVSPSDPLPPTIDLGPSTIDPLPPTVLEVATRLTVAANRGLRDHATKPQRDDPLIATNMKSHTAAEAIIAAGVPLPFAEAAIYEAARTNAAEGRVKTLGYFTAAVVRQWEKSCASAAAVNGNGHDAGDDAIDEGVRRAFAKRRAHA